MDDYQAGALAIAEKYFTSWTDGDVERLRALMSVDVTLVLPFSGETPEPVFRFDGVDQTLGYLQFAHSTFERLTFRDEQWVVSQDARFVYLHAVGDMVAKPNDMKYDNVYMFRLQLRDGRINEVLEYTNPVIWTNLGLG